MYKIKLLFIPVIFLISLQSAAANDHSEIQQVIQKYFDGTSQGKPELVEQAFMPSLEIQYIRDGEFRRISGPDYIAKIKKGIPVDRRGRIMSIDIAGDTAAAKLIIDYKDQYIFTDYILLLKLKNGWKISNKIANRRDK